MYTYSSETILAKMRLGRWQGRPKFPQVWTPLSHHAGKSGSVESYSRDQLRQPVSMLCSLLDSIREGSWNPDDMASGYPQEEMSAQPNEPSPTASMEFSDGGPDKSPMCGEAFRLEEQDEAAQEDLVTDCAATSALGGDENGQDSGAEDASDNGSDSTNSLSDDGEKYAAIAELMEVVQGRSTSFDSRRFLNESRRTVHAGKPGSATITKCGLNFAEFLLLASGDDEEEEGLRYCKSCFKSAVARLPAFDD